MKKVRLPPLPDGIPSEPVFIEPRHLFACTGKRVALDTETTGLQWQHDKLIGLGVWCPDAHLYGYIPTLTDSERVAVKTAVREAMDEDTVVIAHNAKFDFHFLDFDPTRPHVIDTTIPVHLLDSRYSKRAEDVERIFLGTETKKELVERQPVKMRRRIWTWPLNDVCVYCINDVRIEYAFAEVLLPMIDDEGLWDLAKKEFEYLKLLWQIERTGVLLDVEWVNWARARLAEHKGIYEQMLFDAVGYEFNLNSHPQLSKALYDDLGVARPKNPFADKDGVDRSRFADRGKYNSTMTSTFILMEKAHHPLGELISAWREVKHLDKMYIAKWLKQMDPYDILHTGFNQTGTRTGRLSSSDPNLQNVPSEARGRFTQSVFSGNIARTDEYNLRKAIVARPGNVYVGVDWKQMEMRMFGILSEDPFMLSSLNAGRDIHGDIAEKVWGSRDSVRREWAKTISFGLIYGMTTGSVQFKLNMTRKQAQDITEQYWKTFPRIKPWLYGVIDECRKFGHIRYWSNRKWVEESEMDLFKGANAQIQGGCADLLSIAALRVADLLESTGWGKIINLVHDEIIVETPPKNVKKLGAAMQEIMRLEDIFGVPWFTDVKVGEDYGSMHEVTK